MDKGCPDCSPKACEGQLAVSLIQFCNIIQANASMLNPHPTVQAKHKQILSLQFPLRKYTKIYFLNKKKKQKSSEIIKRGSAGLV
jgi:hypothetical protein